MKIEFEEVPRQKTWFGGLTLPKTLIKVDDKEVGYMYPLLFINRGWEIVLYDENEKELPFHYDLKFETELAARKYMQTFFS
jgi:hypothetical protein